MKSFRVPSLLAALACSQSTSALTWVFDGSQATCQGNPFMYEVLMATCYQKPYYGCKGANCQQITQCGKGDTPIITGTLTATRTFPNSQVVVKPCMLGVCPSTEAKVDGRICDWISPTDDQSCGEPGSYAINKMTQLPESGWSYIIDHLTMKIHVEKPTCESQSASGGYSLVGLGVAAGVALAFWGHRRRKRTERGEEEDSFVELGSKAKRNLSAIRGNLSAITPPRDRRRRLADGGVESFDDEESYVEMGSMANCSDLVAVAGLRGWWGAAPRQSNGAPPEKHKRKPSADEEDDGSAVSEKSAPSKQEISLEVLKEWYDKQGIAIV